MARASVIKIIGAFVAGLIVALASALIYVQAHEKATPMQVAQIEQAAPAPAPEEKGVAPTPAPPPTDTGSADTVPDTSTVPDTTTETTPIRRVRRSVAKPRPMVRPETPVQVVENTPTPEIAPPASATPQQTMPAMTTSAAMTTPIPVVAPPTPHVVELPAGMPVAIRLGEKLSTDQNYTGDTFRGTLDQQIIRNGFIIAERGSKVLGRVAEADKARRIKGLSQLSLVLTEINTTDGQQVEVQTNAVEKVGQKSTGQDTAKIAGGAALGAIIGALGGGGRGAAIGAGAGGAAGTGVVLATRGKAAVLPVESRLTFALASPVTITEKLNR